MLLVYCVSPTYAQVWETFDSLDLGIQDVWEGDLGDFVIEDGELVLSADMAGSSEIRTLYPEGDYLEWELEVYLDFSPSSNNYFQWWLGRFLYNDTVVDLAIRIGEDGSEDGVDLLYYYEDQHVVLIDGLSSTLIQSSNYLKMNLQFNPPDEFLLRASFTPSGWMNVQGVGYLSALPVLDSLRLECTYTVSNTDGFRFDNLYAGPIRIDDHPPEVVDVDIIVPNIIQVKYNELVDSMEIQNPQNYHFVSEDLFIDSIIYDKSDPQEVSLLIDSEIQSDISYQLTIQNMKDTVGNCMCDTLLTIYHHQANLFDIVFSEIMADPSPSVDLPEYEYIELYNRSAQAVRLKAYTLKVGTRTYSFPDYSIEPYHYLLLTSVGNCLDFGPFISCLGLIGNQVITNSGIQFQFLDSLGRLISFDIYDPLMHDNDFLSEGGYSVEKLNLDLFCDLKDNWETSSSSNGGTPGVENSNFSEEGELFIPKVDRLYWVDSLKFGLIFSESIPKYDEYFGSIQINNLSAIGIEACDYLLKDFLIYSQQLLSPDTSYLISVSNYWECNSIPGYDTILTLRAPHYPIQDDILINEILYDPLFDGVDYIELYNNSDLVFDLDDLLFAQYNSYSNTLDRFKPLSDRSYLFNPHEYLVVCVDPDKVMSQFPYHDQNSFVHGVEFSMPVLPNDSGNLYLLNSSRDIIDQFYYRPDFHHPLLRDREGIALERVYIGSNDSPGNEWFSASEIVDFGTPGLQNSQLQSDRSKNMYFSISDIEFSPNQDGNNDLYNVNFNFPLPGYLVLALIYDINGRKVDQIFNWELFPQSGSFFWDGSNEADHMVGSGFYFLYVEYFHPQGDKGKERFECSLKY